MAAGASRWDARALRAGAWFAFAFAVLTVAALWALGAASPWQFERVAFEGGAWWQLATSQWVHLTWPHAAVNIAAAAVMLVALAGWVDLPTQGVALLGGYAGVALVVALDPTCAYYAGASGALHGLLAGSGVKLALTKGPSPNATGVRQSHWSQVLGWTALAGMGVKLFFQHFEGASSEPGWLGVVAYRPAHVGGAVAGAIFVALGSALHQVAFAQHQRRQR
jgi:membrane associated rhomboid family serine protease